MMNCVYVLVRSVALPRATRLLFQQTFVGGRDRV